MASRRGIVATSQPLAAQVGLLMLESGGNAVDAAVAASAALAVVEPTGTGMGGDAFALVFRAEDQAILALNGSGRSPAALTSEMLQEASHGGRVPSRGALAITVPGAVRAWADLLTELGTLSLAEVLAPAIRLASDGYPVSELIAAAWGASAPLLAGHPAAALHFLPGGRAPRFGETVRLPALATSLRAVASEGPRVLYEGPIAKAIVRAVHDAGGFLSEDDLASHASTWETPLRVRYGPLDVWECPPNGQGLAALVALGVADRLEAGRWPWTAPERLNLLIPAMRAGFDAVRRWVGDPAFVQTPTTSVLSDAALNTLAEEILAGSGPGNDHTRPPSFAGSDTVYVAAVDTAGNACSLISSNYMGFGSGIVAGETGIPLQNRGAGFTLQPGHPNTYAPRKRPFHTIMPGLATHADGQLAACFGVMGGHMQPQGHLQLISNLVDYGMDPQQALDAPRFQIVPDGRVALEPWFGLAIRASLADRHTLVAPAATPSPGSFGGGQAIIVVPNGTRIAGSDPRKDGQAAAQA